VTEAARAPPPEATSGSPSVELEFKQNGAASLQALEELIMRPTLWFILACARALRCAPARPAAPLTARRSAVADAQGLHGSASCFLPLDQLRDDLRWPRLLRVAGAYPGLTGDELAAPPACALPAANGQWNFEFPDPHGSDFGVARGPRPLPPAPSSDTVSPDARAGRGAGIGPPQRRRGPRGRRRVVGRARGVRR